MELKDLINHSSLTLYDEKNYFSSLYKKKRFHIQLPKHKSWFCLPVIYTGDNNDRLNQKSALLKPGLFLSIL